MHFDENEPKIEVPKSLQEMHIEDNKNINSREPKEHMKKNLNEIIEKAVKVRQEKILFDVDNMFLLEGNLQRTIYLREKEALLKLKLTKTREQESTDRAKGYFADFGISESNKPQKKQEPDQNETSSFPDYDLTAKSEEDAALKARIIQ